MTTGDPARFGARVLPYEGTLPEIHETAFLTAGVTVIGAVRLAESVSIWYNSVLRGDVCTIEVGARSNIQDGCMVHGPHGGHVTRIGSEVTIGHHATIHGCTLEDRCLVGIGAVVLDFARVESEAMIAAGAVVTPNTRVQRGMLYAGIPAKPIRELTTEEIDGLAQSAQNYVNYAQKTIRSLS
jgi:carbonic anhydrase/acetyltransferase-like protein (isoleucine patch superfamily)